jgi:ribonuclease P protein component
MNRKVATKQRVKPQAVHFTAPNVILAGVGAVVLGRKQAKKSYEQAVERVIELRAQIEGEFKSRKAKAKKQIAALQKKADGLKAQAEKEIKAQYKANVAPLQKQIQTLIKQGEAQAKANVLPVVKPVLATLGVNVGVAKKTVRKAVKRAPVRRVKKAVRRKRA